MRARPQSQKLRLQLNLLFRQVCHLSHHALLQQIRERELQRDVICVDLGLLKAVDNTLRSHYVIDDVIIAL